MRLTSIEIADVEPVEPSSSVDATAGKITNKSTLWKNGCFEGHHTSGSNEYFRKRPAHLKPYPSFIHTLSNLQNENPANSSRTRSCRLRPVGENQGNFSNSLAPSVDSNSHDCFSTSFLRRRLRFGKPSLGGLFVAAVSKSSTFELSQNTRIRLGRHPTVGGRDI